jgi:hypothetical protein
MGMDIKKGIPAVKGFETGKPAVLLPAIGKTDLVPKPGAPDLNRI